MGGGGASRRDISWFAIDDLLVFDLTHPNHWFLAFLQH